MKVEVRLNRKTEHLAVRWSSTTTGVMDPWFPDLILVYDTDAVMKAINGEVSLNLVHWAYQFRAIIKVPIPNQVAVHRWFRRK
jgi:hypothetical protein